ncbi:MAG: acyltransferase [Ferruginibacter sp.]|nr:acyltransferase [Ferruginibacter sp.]
MQNEKLFFPNLDGIRFVAFLMVFIGHAFTKPFQMLGINNLWVQNIFYLLSNGGIGVSIFFVLSGFLITYLILAEVKLNGKLDVFKFYIRRSLRIWPLYFLLMFIIFVVFRVSSTIFHLNWDQFGMRPWYYFTFISNFDVLRLYLISGADFLPSTVSWSVSIEEQFYLIWPLLFTLIPAKFYRFIFPFLLLCSYTWRCINAHSAPILYLHTLSVCGDLALGGWVAWLSFTKKEFVLLFANQSNTIRKTIYFAGLIFFYSLQFLDYAFIHVFGRLLQTVFFCYIILDQNFFTQLSFKFSNNRFMSFWGKYTYGLYLWHTMALFMVTLVFTKVFHLSLSGFYTNITIALVGLVVTFFISYFSFHLFEKYFLDLKKKFAFISKN